MFPIGNKATIKGNEDALVFSYLQAEELNEIKSLQSKGLRGYSSLMMVILTKDEAIREKMQQRDRENLHRHQTFGITICTVFHHQSLWDHVHYFDMRKEYCLVFSEQRREIP